MSERSGVVNIGLEGIMLASSAFASVAVHAETGQRGSWTRSRALRLWCARWAWFMHAALVVRGRIDAIVSGIAINLVAAGGTRFVLRALFGSSSNSPVDRGVSNLRRGSLPSCSPCSWWAAAVWMHCHARVSGWKCGRAERIRRPRMRWASTSSRIRLIAVSIGGAAAGRRRNGPRVRPASIPSRHDGRPRLHRPRGRHHLWVEPTPCRHRVPGLRRARRVANRSPGPDGVASQSSSRSLPFVATLFALVTVSRRAASKPPAGLGRHPTA